MATTHALGTVSTKDGHRTFSQIIPRNATLPRRESKTYEPRSKAQTGIMLEVWEGDPKKPLGDPENFLLAKVRVPLPQRLPQQQNTFSLTYSYDTDGLLHVKAETANGYKLLDENVEKFGVQESGANVTPESLQRFLEDFSGY